PGTLPWPPDPNNPVPTPTPTETISTQGDSSSGDSAQVQSAGHRRVGRSAQVQAAGSPVSLPARPLPRQLYPQEITARVDWSSMDVTWQTRRDALVRQVHAEQLRQIDELHDQIVDAGN